MIHVLRLSKVINMSTIPPDLQAFVESRLASGNFQSLDEVAFAAMRAVRDKEEKVAQLRLEIAEAIQELDAGLEEEWEVESIKRELREEFGEHGK